jgi:hypothetical protein
VCGPGSGILHDISMARTCMHALAGLGFVAFALAFFMLSVSLPPIPVTPHPSTHAMRNSDGILLTLFTIARNYSEQEWLSCSPANCGLALVIAASSWISLPSVRRLALHHNALSHLSLGTPSIDSNSAASLGIALSNPSDRDTCLCRCFHLSPSLAARAVPCKPLLLTCTMHHGARRNRS